MSVVTFIKAFATRLRTLDARSYYGDEIDPDVKIPHSYFGYATTEDIESLEDFIIEVNITGYSRDLDSLEALVDTIDGDGAFRNPTGLNYYHYGSGASPTFTCYRLSRLKIPALDEGIARRQLRYRVRVYL